MSPKLSAVLKFIKEYGIITIGIFSYTLGWAIFLIPNNLIGGGVSGISSIIQYATGIPMGYSYFVINIGLLIASLIVIGPSFGAKTVYAIALTSVCLNVFQVIIPETIISDFALSNGKLMCCVIGGVMSGLGIGLSMSQGGSTGGTDIIALIINKYHNVSPGKIILTLDVFIILSSLLVPSFGADGHAITFDEKFVTVVYGLILVVLCGNVVDIYLAGSKQSVQLFIFSKHYDEIADMIRDTFHRGVTVLEGQGWYTKQKSSVLLVVTRKTDLNFLMREIKMIDPDAFMSISYVNGVYGQGFDTFKTSKRSSKKN